MMGERFITAAPAPEAGDLLRCLMDGWESRRKRMPGHVSRLRLYGTKA